MRMKTCLIKYIIALITVLAGVVSAADISVESVLDRNKGYIGDRIQYSLSIVADTNFAVDTISPVDKLGDFKVRKWQLIRDTILNDQRFIEYNGVVTTYETGKIRMPAFPITYHQTAQQADTIYTDSMEVFILSLVMDDSTADIKALKEVKSLNPVSYLLFYLIPIILILTGIIIWYFTRKSKAEEQRSSLPLKTPWEEASDRLIMLKEKNLEPKPFYLEFSIIIKEYLQRRFGFSAPDMTTYEILQETANMNIDKDLKVDLVELMKGADLVKFAKLIPAANQMTDDLEKAWNFVAGTTPGRIKTDEVEA